MVLLLELECCFRSNEAARTAVSLVVLWLTGEVNH